MLYVFQCKKFFRELLKFKNCINRFGISILEMFKLNKFRVDVLSICFGFCLNGYQ